MITVIIKYKGKRAREFANEMISSGLVDKIRNEEGNLRYEYFYPLDNDEAVLLIDSWINQDALDKHHALPLMKEIIKLREKYDLHMEVNKYEEIKDSKDDKYIRK